VTSKLTEAFIGRIELFKDLNPEECRLLQEKAEALSFEPGELIFTEHSPRRYLFILEYGEVELFKTTPQGEETRLSFFRERDFLGEGALMDDYPHSTTARALLETRVFRISREDFFSMFEEHPAMAMKILSRVARVVSRRMRQASTRVLNVGAQYVSGRTRSEHDLLGDRDVPHEFYYGVQTLRALENFNISGVPLALYPGLIQALTEVKMAAARANADLGHLSKPVADAIEQACQEIIGGKLHGQFVVDMIQGGAGTSTNMNANEVIANRALEILGYEKGQYEFCHPNNHVNLSQSTNDAYPTAL
jgi:aspartate ammonia-lyase